MTRLRGRAPRGERLHASAPSGRWETTTMISSVRLDGSTACMAIGCATNTEVFRAYVSKVLLPTLRQGDVVIMDNLGAHRNAQTLELITNAGASVLFGSVQKVLHFFLGLFQLVFGSACSCVLEEERFLDWRSQARAPLHILPEGRKFIQIS